jgi:hypothetical protein
MITPTTNFVDSQRQPIPYCNIVDNENSVHTYAPDKSKYKQFRKDLDASKTFALIFSFFFILMLCIFTLNLGAAGWSMGNLLTFVVAIVGLYFLTCYTKIWLESNASMNQLIQQGNPCIVKQNGDSIVHCKAHG